MRRCEAAKCSPAEALYPSPRYPAGRFALRTGLRLWEAGPEDGKRWRMSVLQGLGLDTDQDLALLFGAEGDVNAGEWTTQAGALAGWC